MIEKSWKEEAWEEFLALKWDKRPKGIDVVFYNKKDLAPILERYSKSGQGEIRIFHYEHEKLEAVKKRNVMKIPISRSEWALVKRPSKLNFYLPKKNKVLGSNNLTEGMLRAVEVCRYTKANPGETTLLAIANRSGLIADFYNLSSEGVMFTGGRQNAQGCHIVVSNKKIDMSKALIEIDAGFEWPKHAVIIEMKSSFNQDDFDLNQSLIPLIKWQGLIEGKKVYSMVLLGEVMPDGIVFHAYDLVRDTKKSPFGMKITKSCKYTIELK